MISFKLFFASTAVMYLSSVAVAQQYIDELAAHVEDIRSRQLQVAPTFVSASDKIPAAPGGRVWERYDVDGAICRDGSQTGYYIRMGDSDKLVIFFQGGGACFNGLCNIISSSSQSGPGDGGVFDIGRNDNPLKDYTFVFLPYCTGDVFFGDKVGNVGGTQRFKGRNQVNLVMQSVVNSERFNSGLTSLIVTGESAGSFGASVNYDFIRSGFIYRTGETTISPGIETSSSTLIADSGIAFDSEVLTPCLNRLWRDTWNAQLPADCPQCFSDTEGFYSYYDFLYAKYTSDIFSFVSQNTDAVIALFYSFGQPTCGLNFFCFIGWASPTCGDIPGGNAGPNFSGGLMRFQSEKVANTPNTCSFFWDGILHTHTGSDGFYSKSANGINLQEWYSDVVSGTCVDNLQGSIFTAQGANSLAEFLNNAEKEEQDKASEAANAEVALIAAASVSGCVALIAVGVAVAQRRRAKQLEAAMAKSFTTGEDKQVDIEANPSL